MGGPTKLGGFGTNTYGTTVYKWDTHTHAVIIKCFATSRCTYYTHTHVISRSMTSRKTTHTAPDSNLSRVGWMCRSTLSPLSLEMLWCELMICYTIVRTVLNQQNLSTNIPQVNYIPKELWQIAFCSYQILVDNSLGLSLTSLGCFKNSLSGKNLHLNVASTKVPTDSPSKNLQVLPSRSISAQAARFSIGSFFAASFRVQVIRWFWGWKKKVSKVYHLI